MEDNMSRIVSDQEEFDPMVHGTKSLHQQIELIYDILIHNGSAAIDVMRYTNNVGLDYIPMTSEYKVYLDLRSSSGIVIAARNKYQLRAYTSLVNKCREREVLPELFMELQRASYSDDGSTQWWSGSNSQLTKQSNPTSSSSILNTFGSPEEENNSLYQDLQELEIIEDASEIDTNIDFETRMYQLASDTVDVETAQVLDYIPDGDTVTVIFRLPDESIAKRGYNIPDSTNGEFVTLLDVATVQHSIDADVDLKNVEMLVGALVPIKEITGTWYVDESIDITEEETESEAVEEMSVEELQREIFKEIDPQDLISGSFILVIILSWIIGIVILIL